MTSDTTPPPSFAALVQTVLRASEQLPAAAAVTAPAGPGKPLRRGLLVNDLVSRCAVNAVGTAQLLASEPDPDTLSELFAMQTAFMNRLWQMDQDWRTGLLQLYQEWMSLREANTLSKVIEQDYNLGAQFGDLVMNYVTSAATLVESTNVGYAYWLSKKIGAKPSP